MILKTLFEEGFPGRTEIKILRVRIDFHHEDVEMIIKAIFNTCYYQFMVRHVRGKDVLFSLWIF